MTHAVRRMPIAFIHQDLGLIDWMTVAENICLTLGYSGRCGLIEWSWARKRAARALAKLGADIDPDLRIQSLTRTEKSLVAIARALATDAEILVLDEPTASLPADEVVRLFGALRRLRDHGVGMIYVSHRLDEVFEIADRMVVLRDGQVAGERVVAQTTPDETILLIVGREPSPDFQAAGGAPGRAAARIRAGLLIGAVGPIDASIHAGEIVGLVGLRGAGQETISRALFGVEPTTGGRIRARRASRRDRSRRGRRWIWASISSAPTASANPSCRASPCARISSSIRSPPGGAATCWLSPREECEASRKLGETVGLRPNDPEPRHRAAFGRQPAEGRRRALAQSGSPSSMCSRTRPPASTSARRPRSTGCSTSR